MNCLSTEIFSVNSLFHYYTGTVGLGDLNIGSISVLAEAAWEPESTWGCAPASAHCCFPVPSPHRLWACRAGHPVSHPDPCHPSILGSTEEDLSDATFPLCMCDFLSVPEGCSTSLGMVNQLRPGNTLSFSTSQWHASTHSSVKSEGPFQVFPASAYISSLY